jgi:hypothetical protein
VERIDDQVYRISRVSGSDVIVYLTNEYIVGLQFYLEALSRFPGINAIVTVPGWNSYTKYAKESAAKDSVGVFVMKEFFGAINWKQSWKYLKKDAKGDPIRFWRERSPD